MKNSRTQTLRLAVVAVMSLAWTAAFAQITPSADFYTNTATSTTNYGAKTLLDVDGASQISSSHGGNEQYNVLIKRGRRTCRETDCGGGWAHQPAKS